MAELGAILSGDELAQLQGCVSREEQGQTLKDIAAVHGDTAERMESWSVRAALMVLFLVLALGMAWAWQIVDMASVARGGW